MRGSRKTRDQAMQQILAMLTEHPGTRFKPSHVASNLQIGRERTAALLRALQDAGKVTFDDQGWFVSLANHESFPSHISDPQNETYSDARTWVVVGHIGGQAKVTIEFTDKATEAAK